jgi:hypothetical protein
LTEWHFTLGAHLLLWVFPLALTVTAVLIHLLGRRRGERE